MKHRTLGSGTVATYAAALAVLFSVPVAGLADPLGSGATQGGIIIDLEVCILQADSPEPPEQTPPLIEVSSDCHDKATGESGSNGLPGVDDIGDLFSSFPGLGGLPILNGFPMFNGLPSFNELSSFDELPTFSGLSELTDIF